MLGTGFMAVLVGIIAEIPITVSAAQGGSDGLTAACMALIGWMLAFWGLSQMATTKRLTWAFSLLTLCGIPGTMLGLIIVLVMPNRNRVEEEPQPVEWCQHCGRQLHRSGRCISCDGVV